MLGDADIGDVFDVEIFMDPDYGTFVFHVVSGVSKCPVEKGTTPREQPSLSLASRPSAALLPDETMIFEVELTNEGASPSAFQLFTDHRRNGGLLGHLANGDTLTVPQHYDVMEPGETVTTTITIERGPALFDYPSIPIIFRSVCENTRNIGEGNLIALDNRATASIDIFNVVDPTMPEGERERIRFAQPCPGIAWEGELAFERTFRINEADRKSTIPSYTLKVVVRNLNHNIETFNKTRESALGRLADAGLFFRRVGTVAWSRALNRPSGHDFSVPINFIEIEEDEYGYLTVEWDVGALGDGEYEIEARTICPDPTGDLPDDFNFATTSRLKGFIDRSPPSLYGPAFRDVYSIDYPIEVEFSETLECAQPHSFTLKVDIDNGSRILDNSGDGLLVVCEGRSISFQFDPAWVDHKDLVGKSVRVELSGVEDLNENAYNGLITGSWLMTNVSNVNSTSNGGDRRELWANEQSHDDMYRDTTTHHDAMESGMKELHAQLMTLHRGIMLAVAAIAVTCVAGLVGVLAMKKSFLE